MNIFRNHNILFLLFFLFSFYCREITINDLPDPFKQNYSYVSDPYQRWKLYNLKSYFIEQQRNCYCIYGGHTFKISVRDNKITNIEDKSTGKNLETEFWNSFKTIEELFEIVKSIYPNKVANFKIVYDNKYGYPSLFYVDISAQIADEEFGYQTFLLEKTLP